jgi:hypothetical protein
MSRPHQRHRQGRCRADPEEVISAAPDRSSGNPGLAGVFTSTAAAVYARHCQVIPRRSTSSRIAAIACSTSAGSPSTPSSRCRRCPSSDIDGRLNSRSVGKIGDDSFHQIEQRTLVAILPVSRNAFSTVAPAVEEMGVEGVEHPFGHRVRHLRKTREKVVIAHAKTGNAVERVGNDVHATRKGAEQQANIGDLGAEAGTDLTFGIRMQDQVDAQREPPPPGACGRRVCCRCRRS